MRFLGQLLRFRRTATVTRPICCEIRWRASDL